jgi:small subunit ribosomal protein S2
MSQLPSAVFIVDPARERIAVQEASRLGLPIIAICDTNCNPDPITYPIPGNDDAIRAVRLFTAAIADAVMSIRSVAHTQVAQELTENFAATADTGTETQVVIRRRSREAEETAPVAPVAPAAEA